jgi:TetR/AcrR family transcriptional repressor of nem operon
MSKGEATRQRIIATAAGIINQRGYKGCSLQDIMEATGLEKGGIYRHFESKEELAAEAFDFAWNTAFAARTHDLDSIADPIERLKQHISRVGTRSPIPGGCPLLNTAIDSDHGNAVLRERVRKALRGWQTMLHHVLEDGIAQGKIRRGIDVEGAANHIIASLEGGMVVSRLERNDAAISSARRHLEDYIETQLRRPMPPKKRSPQKGTSVEKQNK